MFLKEDKEKLSGNRITKQGAVFIAVGYARCVMDFVFVIMNSIGFRIYIHYRLSFFYPFIF